MAALLGGVGAFCGALLNGLVGVCCQITRRCLHLALRQVASQTGKGGTDVTVDEGRLHVAKLKATHEAATLLDLRKRGGRRAATRGPARAAAGGDEPDDPPGLRKPAAQKEHSACSH